MKEEHATIATLSARGKQSEPTSKRRRVYAGAVKTNIESFSVTFSGRLRQPFSVPASERYDCVRDHRQQASVNSSATTKLGISLHVEEFVDKTKDCNESTPDLVNTTICVLLSHTSSSFTKIAYIALLVP